MRVCFEVRYFDQAIEFSVRRIRDFVTYSYQTKITCLKVSSMASSSDDVCSKTIERAVKGGAANTFHKPFSASERHSKVDQALKQRLVQLRTALGGEPSSDATNSIVSETRFTPMPPVPGDSPAPFPPTSSTSVSWLMLSGAALLLAGTTWYVQSQTPAASADRSAAAVRADSAMPEARETTTAAPLVVPRPTSIHTLADSYDVQLRELIESWRQAWSSRRTEEYLSFYGKAFQPERGVSLDQWKARRFRNVSGKADINVEINDLRLTMINEQLAQATFLQDYHSGSYKETAQRKTLLLAREGDVWRIVKEGPGF
jgi:hypothetical protein